MLFQLDQEECELNSDKYGALFLYKCQTNQKLPPPTVNILLQPRFGVINFPSYFSVLYQTMHKYHRLCMEVDKLQSLSQQQNNEELSRKITELSKEKIAIFSKLFTKLSGQLGSEGIELVLPYIEELFSNRQCYVNAVWSLFSHLAALLGPKKTCEKLLPQIVKVFDAETITSKHVKLYHRSFIVQLKVRLGLQTFLTTFSTLLVEACAGYKDFLNCDDFSDDKNPGDGLGDPMALNLHDDFDMPVEGDTSADTSVPVEDSDIAETSSNVDNYSKNEEEIEGEILLEGKLRIFHLKILSVLLYSIMQRWNLNFL